MNFSKLLPVLMLTSALFTTQANAQSTTANASMPNYKTTVHALGDQGIAIVGYGSKNENHVVRIGADGKLLWEKDYPMMKGKTIFEMQASSSDGRNIYILGFSDNKEKGGGKNPGLTRIDAISGESKMKEWAKVDFGHVLSMYANDKYLFVLTTYYSMDDSKIEKDPQLKLYRFDNATLEMTELQHDMNTPGGQAYVFWQMIRVESDFVEGYIIKDGTANSMTVVLARFDNDGKEIYSKEVPLSLKSSNTRETNGNMPLAPGVSRYKHQQNVTFMSLQGSTYATMITPMTMCYLTYHPEAHTYFAYGFTGPGEQKKVATQHTGFFVAKLDSSFALLKLMEHTSVPAISGNGNLKMQSAPDSRYISGYVCGKTDLFLEFTTTGMKVMPKVQIQVSGSDLSIGKSATVDVPAYIVAGNSMAGASNVLATLSSVTAKNTKMVVTSYAAITTRQYAVIHSVGKVEVLSEELK